MNRQRRRGTESPDPSFSASLVQIVRETPDVARFDRACENDRERGLPAIGMSQVAQTVVREHAVALEDALKRAMARLDVRVGGARTMFG